MKIPYSKFILLLILFFCTSQMEGQISMEEFLSVPEFSDPEILQNNITFNGYTNYWHDTYDTWYRSGNLFKMKIPDIYLTRLQSKIDVAEDLGMPGLLVQEGWVSHLLSSEYRTLNHPSTANLKTALEKGNVLVTVRSSSSMGQDLEKIASPIFEWVEKIKSHQFKAASFMTTKAFRLTNGKHNLFVILSDNPDEIEKFTHLLQSVKQQLTKYRMHKGYFGAKSLLKSVTIQPGHPLDLIGKGLNEGNTWFIFDGYMDFLAKEELENWIKEVDLPIYVDVGFSPIYGCVDYEGLQVQDLQTRQAWIDYAKSKNGYIFQPVYDPGSENYNYDGYISHPGNKEHIDHEDVPFIHETGFLSEGLTSAMVLFIDKEKPINRDRVWEAIMNRKAVAVSEGAKLMGPKEFRNVLSLLYLDKVYLENYFQDLIDLEVKTDDYQLEVKISNYSSKEVSGRLHTVMNPSIKAERMPEITVGPGQERQLIIPLEPDVGAMGRTNPISVIFSSDDIKVKSLTKLDLPPVLSLHKLLYASESKIDFPITLHNFQEKEKIPVKITVYEKDAFKDPVLDTAREFEVKTGDFEEEIFNLELESGEYIVKAEALGAEAESQLGVGKPQGQAFVYEMDLDSDGIEEYRMENDSVEITLLRTGARIIEYNIKSRNMSNVLFKAWPEKTYNHKAPYRFRGYYPYGGFEDFLGQGSMETHKVYEAKITKTSGDYVQVVMEADFYGNRLEKIFTLYGDSPLVEVRYKLTFHDEDANVIGPQPILELGDSHGPEDVFIVPAKEGLKEYRMRPEEYYGQAIDVVEGWNAGYDTQADISFIGAFPVTEPIFLHMWMNHPKNPDAPHYYVEFQPWTPIVQMTNMYFTYYLWGSGGDWRKGLEKIRNKNLISQK